jgi:prepilin-type N-terminal cleavage/methylation domain-containing protein
MKGNLPIPRQSGARGFSLVELLTVVVIIGIICAFVLPAVNGFGRSAALTSAGNLVTNLANYARQEAVSKNTMTALVVLTGQSVPQKTDQYYRAATIIEYDPVAGWNQLGNWELLPSGIIFDCNDATNCSFLANSPQPFPFLSHQTSAALSYQGQPVISQGQPASGQIGYAARIFLSNGSLQNPDKPAQLRLVEGYLQGSQVIYTRRGQTGLPANYYDIAIVGMTGMTKVDRP